MPRISFVFSHPPSPPRSVELDHEQITLGRSADCTFKISDNFLSRKHAELISRDGAWFVRDCGSANGTYVNGVRIAGEAAVRAGDCIRLGDS